MFPSRYDVMYTHCDERYGGIHNLHPSIPQKRLPPLKFHDGSQVNQASRTGGGVLHTENLIEGMTNVTWSP